MKPVLRYAIDASVIAVLCALLYVPYLSSPPVFDDRIFFAGQRFAEYATTPLGFDLRLPAYFSLAFTEVVWNRIEAHRVVSLLSHIACAGVLYKLLCELLRGFAPPAAAPDDSQRRAAAAALLGAAIFAIHPVAVYAAGYLVQRTIVFATLFSLLSVFLFARGLARRSHADAFSAALLYSLAVLSKEHAILLPAAVLLAIAVFPTERRFAVRHAAVYLLACLPAALVVVIRIKYLIGSTYEPAFDAVTAQIDLESMGGAWLVSAITQAGLFFKYLALWLAPDTGGMSIDIRVDFAGTWSAGWIALKLGAFLAYGLCGFWLLAQRGRKSLLGFGLLYPWILFLVEFTTVRFQEPFVLYRSYLWAPGIMIALATVLGTLPRRAVLALLVVATPWLLWQARDRLQSFSSPVAVWQDAVAKLPSQPVPGGYRTLFQLGREFLYSGEADKAIATANRCIAEYPRTPQCYLARGSIHLYLEQYAEALPYLTRALELDPGSGIAHHHRGVALEKLGRVAEAREEYRQASKLRFRGGDYRLGLLDAGGAAKPKSAPPR